jgi:hypothetical protein
MIVSSIPTSASASAAAAVVVDNGFIGYYSPSDGGIESQTQRQEEALKDGYDQPTELCLWDSVWGCDV